MYRHMLKARCIYQREMLLLLTLHHIASTKRGNTLGQMCWNKPEKFILLMTKQNMFLNMCKFGKRMNLITSLEWNTAVVSRRIYSFVLCMLWMKKSRWLVVLIKYTPHCYDPLRVSFDRSFLILKSFSFVYEYFEHL